MDFFNTLNGWKVLVVDDEQDNSMVAKLLLEMAGALVDTAVNGKEGLSKIRADRPHFVLCDLSMPVMDGWSVIREMNQDRALSDIPVIALTAHAMSGDRERAIQAGFANYISKPLDPDKFINQLVNLVVNVPQLKKIKETLNTGEVIKQG